MSSPRFSGPRGRQRLLWAAIAFGVVWLFGGCLLGHQRLAFRDVSHFYLPLYGYLGERLAADGLPLWNPLDRFGIPVAGEATTAVFYPPRLLFSIGVPVDYAMTLYVVGHLLLAGAGARWAARRSGASSLASVAAATCYPACGAVFFLYTNPPFLVGAAWLPWIVAALLIVVNHPYSATAAGRRSFLIALTVASVALAMAVLGGDPQMAFHAVLFVAGYWFWRRIAAVWQHRPVAAISPPFPRESRPLRGGEGRRDAVSPFLPSPRLTPLLVAVLIAVGLSSLQVFAGLAWSQQSWRQQTQPPNLYQWVASAIFDDAPPDERALSDAATPAHRTKVYDFSVAPWHWAELASPFLSGRLFPSNGRLSTLVPGEPRIWTPTLYAGLLPLLCLLAGPLRPSRWTVWHALVAVGLLMALGEFGAVKLLRVALGMLGLTLPGGLHDAVGGGYWALVTFFPGYGQFRYPAKWLPLAALGLSVWTAVFLSRYDLHDRRRVTRVAGGITAVAVALGVIVWMPSIERSLSVLAAEAGAADRFWGPLDVDDGLRTLRLSLSITALLACAYALLFSVSISKDLRGWLAVLILIGDLAFAASWQLATVDRTAVDPVAADGAARVQREVERGLDTTNFPRRHLSLASPRAWPPAWRIAGADDRIERVEAAQRETWFARWHLAASAAVVNSSVSLGSARSELFWNEARRYADDLGTEQRRHFLNSLCRFMGAEATSTRRVVPSADGGAEGVRRAIAPVANSLPMVRWHGAWGSSDEGDFLALAARTRELMAAIDRTQGKPLPRVEIDGSATQVPAADSASVGVEATGEVQLLEWQPERIRLRVEADAAGLVTVQQLQDGYWTASTKPDVAGAWTELPVYRVDGIAQGVFVPAGQQVVEFRYRPTWLIAGSLTTAATILALVILLWWQWGKSAPRS